MSLPLNRLGERGSEGGAGPDARMGRRAVLRGGAGLLAAGLLGSGTGCAIFGYAAQAVGEGPVKSRYPKGGGEGGLAGQTVAVMVWVDRGIRIDWPSLQLDSANAIHQKLMAAQKDGKKELKGASFPVLPASVVRYMREHPETDAVPIVETAPHIFVTRLIYVEIHDFQTRPDAAMELFRGQIAASIKVVEVDDAGNAKIGYQEDDVRVVVPEKAPPEGLPGTNDVKIYQALLNEFTTQVAWRFFEHWEKQ